MGKLRLVAVWKWCVVAAVVGLLCAGADLSWLAPPARTLDVTELEARLPPLLDRAEISNLEIVPLLHGYEVTGDYQIRTASGQLTETFRSDVPATFIAPDSRFFREHSQITVFDLLQTAARGHPEIVYRYVWWRSPIAVVVFCLFSGLLIVGGAWPYFIAMIAKNKSSQTIPDFQDHVVNSRATSGGSEQLCPPTDLEGESSKEPLPHVAGTSIIPEIRKLTADSQVETVSSNEIEPEKKFGGEFYPTIVHPDGDSPQDARLGMGAVASRKSNQEAGFTIVELMVVIAIIALLVGVLMPALSRARESAKTVQCLSNMRQITMALFGYCDDNDGKLPAGGSSEYEAFSNLDPHSSFDWIAWHSKTDPVTGVINTGVDDSGVAPAEDITPDVYAQRLTDSALARYLTSDPVVLANVFRCPSDDLLVRPNTDAGEMGAYRFSYSINEYVTLVYASSYDEITGLKIPPTGFGPWNNNRYKHNTNLPRGVSFPPGYIVPLFGNNERRNFDFDGKIASIRDPSLVELFLDEDELTVHNGIFNPNPIEYLDPRSSAELLAARHRIAVGSWIDRRPVYGGNVTFIDGHAETMTSRDVLRQIHTSSPIADPVGF